MFLITYHLGFIRGIERFIEYYDIERKEVQRTLNKEEVLAVFQKASDSLQKKAKIDRY